MIPLLQKLDDRTAKVVVIGQGYVGLPVAVRATQVGYATVGFDVSKTRIDSLRDGVSFVGDISNAELGEALANGYTPSDDPESLEGFDVAVISVPTPLRDGTPDLAYIEEAGVTRRAPPPAGCVRHPREHHLSRHDHRTPRPHPRAARPGSARTDFLLGYSPERIDPGNATHTFVNTPKVTSGADEASLAGVDGFFASLVDRTVPVGSPAEAELVKLLENTFRHVNIALVNELAMFARELGVDIWRAIDAASTKPFGYMRFTPGPGVGGHCLPIDPSYLAWRVKQHLGRTFRFVELANDVNEHMPDYVHARVTALLNEQRKSVNGSKVLLLGLAYKRGTSDWRESPSVVVADRLAESGAEVDFCDPHIPQVNARGARFPLVEFTSETISSADVVVVLVDHPEFDPAVIARHAQLVFDAKNIMRDTGFTGEIL